MHLTSNPAFERTCAKSRAGRSTQTLESSHITYRNMAMYTYWW